MAPRTFGFVIAGLFASSFPAAAYAQLPPLPGATTAPSATTSDAGAPPASPDEEPTPAARKAGPGVSVDLAASVLSSPPTLALTTPNGASMSQFGDGPIAPLGKTTMFSFAVNVFARTGTPLFVPLIGVEVGVPLSTGYPGNVPLGPSNAPLTWVKSDGTTYYDGLDVLGLGFEYATSRFSVAASIRPGLRYLRMVGTITQDLLTVDAEAHRWTFSLHADAEACGRFGNPNGVAGVCLFGGPHVYEFGNWANGFVLGLRIKN